MKNYKKTVRDSIIPNDSTQILDLCLKEGENGILKQNFVNKSFTRFEKDSELKKAISSKIKQEKNIIADRIKNKNLNLQKKENNILEDMFESIATPITQRKALLYRNAVK